MRLIVASLICLRGPGRHDRSSGCDQSAWHRAAGQSCEEQPSGPPGFDTAGFAHAQTVYANVDGTNRVSQYDVACFQVS